MNSRKKVLLSIWLGLIISLLVVLWPWIDRARYPEYFAWSLSNKPCPQEFLQKYIKCDSHASNLVIGESEEAIRKRFPFAVEISTLPSSDSRRYWYDKVRSQHKGDNIKLYWLQEDLPMAILVVDGKGKTLKMYKP
jgi:hypothetical protein